jgi:predicted phage terminase large subunit-like protein
MSIIAASYSADLASRMNRDVQRIMEDEPYAELFPATKLAKLGDRGAVRTSDMFDVVGHNGVYRSAGVGGGITGLGCQIAVLDDVIKDRASADSATVLQSVFDWYTSTLYTRLAPGGGIIIMNTRWSTQDLSGRLLEAQAKGEGDEWRVVNFPAIAEQDEEHRKKGEALHPERYPLEALERIKQAIGTRDWEALYQQHPVPDGGAIFKDEWLQRTWLPKDLPARFDAVIMSWDLSFKGGDASDFVVGQLVGRHGADCYILDQERGRWSFTETAAKVKELAERARARFPRIAPRILIEDKANGPAVIDALKREVSGIIPVEPDGSKEARAHAVTALFEAGNVLLPDRSLAPWVDEYRLELTRFPSGAHDDQVDATTQALRYLSAGHRLNINPAIPRQLQGLRFRR